MKRKPIKDQVVVVVGATSGIGRRTAIRFAEQGARVVVSGRSEEELESLVAEIRRGGGQAIAVPADVTDFDQVKDLARRAADAYGTIDTWVHLAAVSMWARFDETTPEEFRQIIEVNLIGQAYGAMAALPYLKREGRGSLIEVSSVEARRALPLQSAYAASKKGMVGFLDALRMELGYDGWPISVTNIMPSSINTPLFDKAKTRLGVKPQPNQPVYEPEVVANAILYAAEHPVRELVVGGGGKGLGLLQRLSPAKAERAMRIYGYQMQYSDQPKSDHAPNNLFHHLPGYDQVMGAFTAEAKPVSLYNIVEQRPWLKYALIGGLLGASTLMAGRVMRARQTPQTPALRMKANLTRLADRAADRGNQALASARCKMMELDRTKSRIHLPSRKRTGILARLQQMDLAERLPWRS